MADLGDVAPVVIVAPIFAFSSDEIDGFDHTDLKRMDRWVVACGLVGIGGVGRWVVGCGWLCEF